MAQLDAIQNSINKEQRRLTASNANRYVVGGGVTKRPDARRRAQDRPLRRGEIIGKRIGGESESEA